MLLKYAQNAATQVTESFKFQNFPGSMPRTPLEGQVAPQHTLLATQPQFTSAAY